MSSFLSRCATGLLCLGTLLSARAAGPGCTIAVIPKGTTHEFWKAIHAGAIKAQQELSASGPKVEIIWKGPFREAVAPVFEKLYNSVLSGEETRIVLASNSAPDYREKLSAELKEMRDSEMWQAGAAVRALRPENWQK